MLHSLFKLLLELMACGSLGVIGLVAAGECSRRAKARRAAAVVPCIHVREVLVRGSWSVIELQCLDCGAVRYLGHVRFGVSNHKSKGHAA